ncbi:hypothetical protein M885DRAFT_7976 [Pelagophyceae sp. CCMP2097]|nr:hypothetical protein M885DRAFT_7976 [Pelagophyceae sp. CCMP2097]
MCHVESAARHVESAAKACRVARKFFGRLQAAAFQAWRSNAVLIKAWERSRRRHGAVSALASRRARRQLRRGWAALKRAWKPPNNDDLAQRRAQRFFVLALYRRGLHMLGGRVFKKRADRARACLAVLRLRAVRGRAAAAQCNLADRFVARRALLSFTGALRRAVDAAQLGRRRRSVAALQFFQSAAQRCLRRWDLVRKLKRHLRKAAAVLRRVLREWRRVAASGVRRAKASWLLDKTARRLAFRVLRRWVENATVQRAARDLIRAKGVAERRTRSLALRALRAWRDDVRQSAAARRVSPPEAGWAQPPRTMRTPRMIPSH